MMSFKVREVMLPLSVMVCALMFAAAPAVAHEFKIGQPKGTIQNKALSTQIFETGSGAVECTEEQSEGPIQTEKSTNIKEAVIYSGCKGLGSSAVISQAKYELSAEGTVTIENNIVIEVPSLLCTIKIPAAGNKGLKEAVYTNSPSGTVELKANITGIFSEGSGTCAGKSTTGTDKGRSTVEFLGCNTFRNPVYKYKDLFCNKVDTTNMSFNERVRDNLGWA
jgi:Tfp pilus assembly major pilin PilA